MDQYAHTTDGPCSTWETMADHEQATAGLCAGFLKRIEPRWDAWGDLLGRWHDLGKYQPDFQRRLWGEQIHVPHAGVGAALAYRRDGRRGLPAAFVIAGHHTGLANLISSQSGPTPLADALKGNQKALDAVLPIAPTALTSLAPPPLPEFLGRAPLKDDPENRRFAFFTRMLFSALVDADRLATAGFYARAEGRVPEIEELEYDDLAVLRDRLDAHVDRLSKEATRQHPSPVNAMRAEVLSGCRAAAEQPPGLFSLTVPTGGGKTLASMSFALRHATRHGLDRAIVVIPFTSIIEQNAKSYRKALGVNGTEDDRNVLEHHSGVDEERRAEVNHEAELRRRIAAENWDAPIIVTTTVEFFESLFSDHPSRCRKLHRIARSVIILDEVQTLPPQFLLAILDALRELVTHYGCTVVLSTATPPALEWRADFTHGLKDVRPIIGNTGRLFNSRAARRVTVEWRTERITPYAELADELTAHRQVLAIVHRRKDARVLCEPLPPEGRFHLSALMCPAHRLERIGEIRAALRRGEICPVVATQLIEAGVDVDFPVVYRALCGLDSLAQSAGRCDREGRLTERAGRPGGRFIVFRAATSPPPGTLAKALKATDLLLQLRESVRELADGLDLYNPEHGHLFFRELYQRESLDAANVQRALNVLSLADAAAAFRLIDNTYARPLVVPWGDAPERVEVFRREPNRKSARALQPFIVQVRLDYLRHLEEIGAAEVWEESLGLPTELFGSRYSNEFGLETEVNTTIDPELLMV